MSAQPPYLAYLSSSIAANELHDCIVNGYYSQAISLCRNLSEGHGDKISDAVTRLAMEGSRHLLHFCHQLWNSEQNRGLVTKHFPGCYGALFDGSNVQLVGKKFDLPLKLGWAVDSDGTKEAWGHGGDQTDTRLKWQLVPIWKNNKVFFIIKNVDAQMFLNSAVMPDSIGDRAIHGCDRSDSLRSHWYLEPVLIEDQHYFFVVNKQFNQTLKLAESVDGDGDRRLWGHNGDNRTEPLRFGWEIKQILSPTLRM